MRHIIVTLQGGLTETIIKRKKKYEELSCRTD